MSDSRNHPENAPENAGQNPGGKKRWFGRGIYGSKDVPIRALDGAIAVMIVLAVILTVWNAANGGFVVAFETNGADVQIASQKIRHGDLVSQPETPVRPGYTLDCWSSDSETRHPWDFAASTVSGDMTLYALWTPAEITVRFDLAGGTLNGADTAAPITVTYGELYGTLPTPEKAGSTFGGWLYSGQVITAATAVTMTGEHVLTAIWN